MFIREHHTAKFCTKLFISSENSWDVFSVMMFGGGGGGGSLLITVA